MVLPGSESFPVLDRSVAETQLRRLMSIDPALASSLAADTTKALQHHGVLSPSGAGACFTTWQVRTESGRFALKVARREFMTRLGEPGVRAWVRGLRRVIAKRSGLPLVPAMDVIELQPATLAVAMTWGERRGTTSRIVDPGGRESRDAVTNQLDELQRQLGQMGLFLGDVPQILWSGDKPFICDWSDLEWLSESATRSR